MPETSRARPCIAVIGSGISGMAAAYYLSRNPGYEVHVYEAESRPGGHTATVDVEFGREALAIDTGFIVFNDRTYPNFIALLDELGVASRPTSMSFSVSDADSGIEYAGSTLDGLFAQRRNLCSPRFLGMLRDILRFNRSAGEHLASDPALENATLGEYLKRYRYGEAFRELYLLPMGAAIWSSDQRVIDAFPLRFFVRFFANHGLLQLRDRPRWRVVEGGSRSYIDPLIAPYRERLHLNTPVRGVLRNVPQHETLKVCLSSKRGNEFFDAVIFACHSDQALKLLGDATTEERSNLAAIPYTSNEVVLHRDTSLLPRSRRAWSSWNVSLGRGEGDKPVLSYNMNILQQLESEATWCVTLNRGDAIDPALVAGRFNYAHPLFTPEGIGAQQRISESNGRDKTWFCGAWLGNGFHEDGVSSALRVAESVAAGFRTPPEPAS